MSTTATHHNLTSSSPAGRTTTYGAAGSSSSGGNVDGSSSSGGGGAGGGGGGGGAHQYPSSNHGPGPCGACKFLRRKCVAGCIFAPYFDSDQGAAHFAAVHKVFGASNVSKLLLHIPAHRRLDAVVTICYEAQARLRDPVHGCVAHIFNLQQQVMNLQTELTYLHAHLSSLEVQIPPPHQTLMLPPQPLSISDLPPPSSSLPTTYDLTSLFDPLAHQPPPTPSLGLQSPAWAPTTMQQHHGHIQLPVSDPMNDDHPAAGASSSSMSRLRD